MFCHVYCDVMLHLGSVSSQIYVQIFPCSTVGSHLAQPPFLILICKIYKSVCKSYILISKFYIPVWGLHVALGP